MSELSKLPNIGKVIEQKMIEVDNSINNIWKGD
jgi:hypothetical protein